MKVLVIGGGGREHALIWKLKQSPRVSRLYCAPGNGGIELDAECLAADVKSLDSLVEVAAQVKPDLTVVGPELPLTLGVVDEFQRRGWNRARVSPRRSCSGTAFRRRIMPSAGRWMRCARRCRTSIRRSW